MANINENELTIEQIEKAMACETAYDESLTRFTCI